MNPYPNTPIYAARRARVAQALAASGGGLAIIATAPEAPRNRDTPYNYRHDSYFYYLTGFTEPDAALLIDAQGNSHLYCQPKDETREIWDGLRLGPAAALAALGVSSAASIADFAADLPKRMENHAQIWTLFSGSQPLLTTIETAQQSVRLRNRYGVLAANKLRDLGEILDEMRLVKDAHELDIMRRAGEISGAAHVRAMQTSKRLSANPPPEGLREYHLDAELLHHFRYHGSQAPAYGSIVAAGANSCILHYRAGDALLKSGDLCLIDAGCELGGYASDITRTFPVNGVFTKPQRTLYEIVLAAQQAAIDATRAGARFTAPHEAAVKVLTQGMLDVGLLDKNKVGSVDDAIQSRAYFAFYMHRTGHWYGMDVHDCGSYLEPSELGQTSERRDALSNELIIDRPARILRPGMTLTIEPGLYVRPAAGVPEEFWNIGIRIEDDAAVTENGCELLSRSAPVQAAEIEALMR